MNSFLEPSPRQTEPSSPVGQAKPVPIQQIKDWDADELLQWILQKKPKLLSGENLEKLKAAFISGEVFLKHGTNVNFFKEGCSLPIGISVGLADLATET